LSERYTKEWQEIGFQGKDPGSDFRAMGLLALDDLSYFAKYHNQSAKAFLAGKLEQDLAIISIHVTYYCLRLVRSRMLNMMFYNNGVKKEIYHEIHSACLGFNIFSYSKISFV
jgi:hypothetical protein